jgi:hypothetical protein
MRRHLGDFDLPGKFIVLCPLNEMLEIKEAVNRGLKKMTNYGQNALIPGGDLRKSSGISPGSTSTISGLSERQRLWIAPECETDMKLKYVHNVK